MRAAEAIWFRPDSPINLAVARILLAGTALWVALSRNDLPSLFGFPSAFWHSVGPERRFRYLFVFNERSEQVLWWAFQAMLILTIAGVLTRWSAIASGLLMYHFAPLESIFRNANPYLLGFTTSCVGLILVGASKSGGAFLLRRRDEPGWVSWQHRWPVATIEFLLCAMYFFAGYSKLFASGTSWLEPRNIRNYIIGINQLLDFTRPSLGSWIASYPLLCSLVAIAGVMFELLFPIVLIVRRARLVFIPLAIAFHVLNAVIFHIYFQAIWLLLIFIDWNGLLTNRRMAAWSKSRPSS